MARRRMIDPNFWQSEDVSKLTIRQRLLLVGLFSNADDEGRLRGTPAFIRSAVFPYEDFTLKEIENDLNCIESIGSIRQYIVDSSKYIQLVNWFKFQRVDKPQRSVIPIPTTDENNHSKNDSENDSSPKEAKGKEFKGSEEEKKGSEDSRALSDPNPRDYLKDLCTKMKIQGFGIYHLDIVYSYIGMAEIEVIAAAIKKSQNKPHSYLTNTLHGMINIDKIIKAEQLPGAKAGEGNGENSVRQGFTNEHDRPYEEQPEWQLPRKYREDTQLPDVS